MSEMARIVARLEGRIADLEHRLAAAARVGPVGAVDTERQRMRQVVGVDADGTPQLGPWVRYGQMAGKLKVHAPPTVGQNMVSLNPGGDFEQGIALPLSWNDDNRAPGDGADPVMTYGPVRVAVTDGGIEIQAPRVVVRCGSSTLTIEDGRISLKADQIEEGA